MKLKLERKPSTKNSTSGTLYVDGAFECYTLEDVVRPAKVAGTTAIPNGTYKIIITQSQKFKRPLPLLIDVPNYEGIRIHPGNTSADTEGCILVGQKIDTDWVGDSRKAFDALFVKLRDTKEPIEIEVV